MGVPVLCSDIPVMREHLSRHSAQIGWFDPESTDSITNAMERLIERYDEYKLSAMAGANDSAVSWDDIAAQYMSVFQSAYDEHHRMRGEIRGMDGIKLSAFHTFHSMMRLDGEAFIRELYRQLLGREPDAGGFHSHLIHLNKGTPKLALVEHILSSEEAERIYSLTSTGAGPTFLAAPASIYERLCLASPQDFVYALYRELLCREPDMAGMSNHLSALANGLPRNRLIGVIILSPEFQELLTCPG
jgi:hypothetical protein